MRRFSDEPRGTFRERGYTARWDREAAAYKRDHPLCVGCEAVGRVELATIVDHVEPHRGDQAKLWDHGNWQGCCQWHHDVVKKRLEFMLDRGEVSATALRLDSAEAIRLTRSMPRTSSVGTDGWPG